MTFGAGDILAGKYEVTRVLGEGNMGIVLAAVHRDLKLLRAVKLMHADLLADAMAVRRFEREARAAARLTSEHVAKVYDVERLENGVLYIVMEHLDGSDLSAVLAHSRALAPTDAALYMLQACDALAEAHSLGIIHRDLKPANLFLTRAPDGSPRIKVLDFGISKVTDPSAASAEAEITMTDTMLGTPLYMSPEQVRHSRSVDERSDIWSIGVILYELVTACRPFVGETNGETLARVLEIAPIPPSQRAKDLPPGLEAVILRCLEKDPAERYANAAELADALIPFAPAAARAIAERIRRVKTPAPPIGPPASLVDPFAPTELRSSSTSDGTITWDPPMDRPSVKRRQRTLRAGVIAAGAIASAGLLLTVFWARTSASPGTTSAGVVITAVSPSAVSLRARFKELQEVAPSSETVSPPPAESTPPPNGPLVAKRNGTRTPTSPLAKPSDSSSSLESDLLDFHKFK